MHDRLSRFDTQPGSMKPPPRSLYPDKPVQGMTRWLVRMVGEGESWREGWKHDTHVWAFGSLDAVGRARLEFYEGWTPADRARVPLRVVEVAQVAI